MIDTLYVTDLDGTLLRGDKVVPPRSVEILRGLIGQGAAVTVASARSAISVRMLNLGEVGFRLPMILMNGVLLYDYASDRILDCCAWEENTLAAVLDVCATAGKPPFLFGVEDGKLHIQYRCPTSEGERIFIEERMRQDPGAFRRVERYSLQNGVYISMQDRRDVVESIRDRLTEIPGVDCVLYSDAYLGDNWYLEAFSAQAGKANGVRRLRERLGARRVVAFGDNLNDLGMLAQADLACVVANGEPEAIAAADRLVGRNDEDGVAAFILEDWQERVTMR